MDNILFLTTNITLHIYGPITNLIFIDPEMSAAIFIMSSPHGSLDNFNILDYVTYMNMEKFVDNKLNGPC